MITTISLVTICHHTKLLQYIDFIPYPVYYLPVTYLFYNWKIVPLNPLHLFHLSPPFLPSGDHQLVLCISECFSYLFVLLLFRFHI